MGGPDLLFTDFQHGALRSLGVLGGTEFAPFSLPGSDNSTAYPIQSPFEGGREESRIELCFFLWALLCAVGGFFYASVIFLCFDLLLC
jgi:hypothetical protein